MFQRARLVAAIVCFAMAACGVARAQSWPARPVTIIVPFAAGGTTDIVGRIVAQRLTAKLGQSFIIENVGGAGGNLGAAKAAQAAPDGYTVFMATVAHTMAPGIYKSLSYNFQRDFEPVTVVATVPNLLIVNPDLPVKNVAELIAYIKAHPHKVNFGSAGIGSTEHMSAELFRSISGTDIVHVPYRGGAPMMADLVSGHIQMAIETSGSATPFIKGEKVRALAVSPAKRSPLFPDLPTLAEAGLNGYDVTTWYGFLFPKGTPEPIRQKLYEETAGILKEPDLVKHFNDIGAEPGGNTTWYGFLFPKGTPEPIRQKLYEETAGILKEPDLVKHFNDIGAEPGGNTPAQFTAFIQAEMDKWLGLAKKAGIQAE